MTSKNNCISFHFGHIFLSTSSTIFAHISPKLAQISPKLPEKELKKHDLQKKRNVCTLISAAIFVKSKHIKRFCKGFHTFCSNLHRLFPDLKGFFPDFHQIKIFEGGLPPPAPPLPTPLVFNLLLKTFTKLMWMPEKAILPQTHLIRFACNVRIQWSPHPWRRLSLKFGILQ